MGALAHLHRAAIARADVGPERRRPARRAPGTLRRPACRATTVAQAMDPTPPALSRTASLWNAWDLLHRSRANHLVVVDDRGRPVGVLDDRTIAQEWPAGPMDAHRTPLHALVRDRDRARPRLHAHDDMRVAARVLLGARTDAVPVVDGAGRLIGLLTLRHVAELAAAGDREPVGTGADRTIAAADGPSRAFSDLKEELAAPRSSALRSTLGMAVPSAALRPFGDRTGN